MLNNASKMHWIKTMGRQRERTNAMRRTCVKCSFSIEGLPPLDGFHLVPSLCNNCIRSMYPGVMDEVLIQTDWICSEVTIALGALNSLAKEQLYDGEAIFKAKRAMVHKCNEHTQKAWAVQKELPLKDRIPLDTVVCFPVLEFNRKAFGKTNVNKKFHMDGFK